MRVQCDVCESAEADVMCCADEAALCADCDVKVHAANKLAVKHQRIPLNKNCDSPRCDICQEKTGFFFCLQDRALLCRSCDVSIHTANALSAAHHRFLVTGIRVSLEAMTGKETAAASPEESLKSVASNITPPIIGKANFVKAVSRLPPTLGSNDKSKTFLQAPAASTVSGILSSPSMPSVTSGLPSLGMTLSSVSGTGSMSASRRSPRDTISSKRVEPTPASQKVYENFYKKNNTITEFVTEAMPGWRVDELLNLQDMAGGCTGDIASSKADAENLGDFDWTADFSLFDEGVCTNSIHEVPELLFGSFSCPRSGFMGSKGKHDLATVPEFEDAFTVPDLDFGPLPDSLPVTKRRRI